MGVDCFKTDFGERIPTDVVYHDGSDPVRMHNFYPILYNETVFRVLEEERGAGEALVFARSTHASGQRFPVHWGGDCESTFESMAESLRGGKVPMSALSSPLADPAPEMMAPEPPRQEPERRPEPPMMGMPPSSGEVLAF